MPGRGDHKAHDNGGLGHDQDERDRRYETLRQDLIIGEQCFEDGKITELVPDRPHEDGDEHTACDQYDERIEQHHWLSTCTGVLPAF